MLSFRRDPRLKKRFMTLEHGLKRARQEQILYDEHTAIKGAARR